MLDLARFVLGEAADMRFVDDRLAHAAAKMAVALPIEEVIDDDALGRPDDAVWRRQVITGEGLSIWIDQPGLAVEPLSFFGVVRAVGLKVIKLASAHARNEDAPDVAPAVTLWIELDGFFRLRIVHVVIEQQPHGL